VDSRTRVQLEEDEGGGTEQSLMEKSGSVAPGFSYWERQS